MSASTSSVCRVAVPAGAASKTFHLRNRRKREVPGKIFARGNQVAYVYQEAEEKQRPRADSVTSLASQPPG
ncbi:hypothetical protein AAFF_G00384130 [Aldrovandia affinis]|uniref:Uncharacterized protein n=1 Tax=Aldrovandia affinis TaxID=143900 RepID=A0AAD7SFG9_9TELE|nr:hypothetical protein AAFF_G00384130 [Aldrovandia affinis]